MRYRGHTPGAETAPLTVLLREVTRSHHLALHEASLMRRLFATDYALAEYRTHLESMLGVVEPLERAAERSIDAALAPHFARRSKWLCEDLKAMGASSAEIGRVPRSHIAPISPARVRGYLYVSLGSMLGGRIIAQRLRSALGTAASIRFYADGVGRADARWTSFCTELDDGARADADETCAGAIATFHAFTEWLAPRPCERDAAPC